MFGSPAVSLGCSFLAGTSRAFNRMTDDARSRLDAVTERGSGGRSAVEFLAASGAFVFHGTSEADLAELLPRQATSYDERTDKDVPQGDPAVCATPIADVALFRALVNPQSVASHVHLYACHFHVRANGSIQFEASVDAIEWASRPESVGWVYVLDRSAFSPYSRMEVRSARPVRPLLGVRVTGDDLPRGIVVIPLPLHGRRNADRPTSSEGFRRP